MARLSAGQRTQVARKVGQALRRSQHQRIVANKAPDGGSYLPRKRRKQPLRSKKGRVKRKKDAMFQRSAYMKVKASPGDVTVGFVGRVARIARVHQQGRVDRINREGRTARYPVRELLGFTEADERLVRDLLIEHLAPLRRRRVRRMRRAVPVPCAWPLAPGAAPG